MNRRIRKYKLYGATTYDLRKIYANLSYELIADQTKITKNGWIMRVLSHENLNTSLHYNNVSLTSLAQSGDAHLDDLTIKQENIEKRVDDMEEKVDINKQSLNPTSVQDPNAVKFFNNDNKIIYISRIVRLKDGKTLERGRAKIKELEANNISITNSNLRKLEIGGKNADILIKEYNKKS